MRSAWIGQLVAESLSGGIDSRKKIDLWLLQMEDAEGIEIVSRGFFLTQDQVLGGKSCPKEKK